MVSPSHRVGNSPYGLEFGELQSIPPVGERVHEAQKASQGRNLQPAPLPGNEVSGYTWESILFVQSRSMYYEWKRRNPGFTVGILLESP